MPRKIVSLEIAGSEIKAAVVEAGFRDYSIEGLHRQSLSAEAGTNAEQIGRFVLEHAADADAVVYALPPDSVTWRTLFLPFRDQRKLAQTVPFELESNVPFSLDDVVVDYQILQRDSSGTTVLAALAPKSEVERHLETLREAGVDPKIVDAGPLAVLNTLFLVPDLPPTYAFVDFGDQGTTVALYRDSVLVGLRTLVSPANGQPAATNGHAAPQGDGDGNGVRRQIGDLRWTILALNGAPLDEGMPCYLAGAGERLDALEETLAEELPVRVERLDRLALRNVRTDLRERAPEFGTNLGLALREVTPSDTIGVNFRKGEFTFHRSEEELKRGLRFVGLLALVVVALTVGDMYVEYRAARARLTAIESQIYSVFDATVDGGGVRAARPLLTLQDEIALLRQDVDMLDDVVPVANSTSVDILRAVSAAIPNRIRVDSAEYLMDPGSVRLTANTDTFESVDAIKRRLLDTGFFSEVVVKDAKKAKEGVDFRMVMDLNKSFRPPAGE